MLVPFLELCLCAQEPLSREFVRTKLAQLFAVSADSAHSIFSFYDLYFNRSLQYGPYNFLLRSLLHHPQELREIEVLLSLIPNYNMQAKYLLYDVATFSRQAV